MKNKNILEFCLSPDLGGLELFVLDCYKYFNSVGNSKVIVAPDKKMDKHFDDENKFHLSRNKFLPILPAIKLAKFIDENEIDIIHFHWTKDIATVVLAKVISKRKPIVVQSRHMNITRFKDDFYHKWLYKNIDFIHAVTYQLKQQLEKFIPKEIRPEIEVVYLGTKEQKIENSKLDFLKNKYKLGDSFILGIVGRIEPTKGQFLVIEALSKLKKYDIKALIIGHTMNQEYLQELKNKAKNLDIEERVIFTGFTKEVNEHMALCDATVLATTKETFGLVVIESMMNKICTIAVNNGGPLEIIEDNKTGLLFKRDSSELADKIKLIYNDKNLKESLASAGYEKAKEKFDSDKQLKKLFEVINNL